MGLDTQYLIIWISDYEDMVIETSRNSIPQIHYLKVINDKLKM